MSYARRRELRRGILVFALFLACGQVLGQTPASDKPSPPIGDPIYLLNGTPFEGSSQVEGSFALIGSGDSPQIALARQLGFCTLAARAGEEASVRLPIRTDGQSFSVTANVALVAGKSVTVWLSLGSGGESKVVLDGAGKSLTMTGDGTNATEEIVFGAACSGEEAAVRWSGVRCMFGDTVFDVSLSPAPVTEPPFPVPRAVTLRPILEQEIIEWDWRMQDGIGTSLMSCSFPAAIGKTISRGNQLLQDLRDEGAALESESREWGLALAEADSARAAQWPEEDERWEGVWRKLHEARRQIVFGNPKLSTAPLFFVKHVPGVFSHQLTQYYGRYARPGGGVFVLDQPGTSMQLRQLAEGAFPQGSFIQPELSADGKRILVAYCAVDQPPQDTLQGVQGRYYHLYEIAVDGSSVRQLTDGDFNDFAPRELPNGQIMFVSTRRGGWHRCGTIGCEVYTLTLMNPDGSDIRTVSYHETQEWDPAVLNDGRVVYTRWDYVDRSAVHYQQLWTVRPDGSGPVAYYGNNTLNPVGVWEPRAIPNSYAVMATAAPHHGMTAGSIVLVDANKGVDGLEPLTRLTPEVPFPESEAPLLPHWRAALAPEPPERTPEMDRWPGQSYRSPFPLSEKYFLAAYSFDSLVGEPKGNVANMFGLYLVDAFGNKELLYRDLNISSAWPAPMASRDKAPSLGTSLNKDAPREGTFLLRSVYQSYPELSPSSVKRLRILQVLPKSTPGINSPPLGTANASPGKQVLGTVPVESDGSAYFRAPAGIPLAFQALDELGQAVQIMRSVTYLQPGENASCIGCHEPRQSAHPINSAAPIAARREPSVIDPGPDGSRPLSYPILVQPVLDRHCIRCHGDEEPAGPEGQPLVLTSRPEGKFTASYNALAPRVSISAWGQGTFPEGNCEPLSKPGVFGAVGSPLMKMVLSGHHDVRLDPGELDRLITWMDANALFYGTFSMADQDRQRKGERISGPDLQ